MDVLATLSRRAQAGDPLGAASALLESLNDGQAEIVTRLLDFAHLPMREVEDWERVGVPVLIRGRFGQIWYVPQTPTRMLLPAAPTVTARALRSLARGVVDLLTSEEA